MKKLIIKTSESLINNVKSSLIKETKRVFINHDGTIAESKATYHEFKHDVIKSAGFGW